MLIQLGGNGGLRAGIIQVLVAIPIPLAAVSLIDYEVFPAEQMNPKLLLKAQGRAKLGVSLDLKAKAPPGCFTCFLCFHFQ